MVKYFCNSCGHIFFTDLKDFDVYCKKCGSFDCYKNTKENADKTIELLNKYELELDIIKAD